MQKAYLLLLILFFPVIIYAQINSGEVIYKVKIAENKSNADSLKARNPSAYGYFAEKDRKVRTTLP